MKTAVIVGLYIGVLTVIVAHLVLLEFAYRVAIHDQLGGGAIYLILTVDGLSLPSTLSQWAIFLCCCAVSILLHELGHIFALVTHRVQVHGIGMGLFLGIPFHFFARYHRDDRNAIGARERASIQSAGIATNHVVGSGALILFTWFDSQIAGWLYALNVVLAIVSAIPLSNTDGDKLLLYMLVNNDDVTADYMENTFVHLLGFGSWFTVAGSMLTIGLATVISLVTG